MIIFKDGQPMNEQHDLAPHHLPRFIPGPDGSDPLFTIVVVLILILGLVLGVVYFKLHALPERMAHRKNSTQLQLIAVLAILALLTHNNIFWVVALLLAVVRLPDFITPLNSIDQSLKTLAERQTAGNGGSIDASPQEPPHPEPDAPEQSAPGTPKQES
jgi:hypothetical protein